MGVIAERTLARTGALNDAVKIDPLPPGVYWADVIDRVSGDANIATFQDWLTLHADTVTVIRESEHNTSADWNVFENDPHRLWVLFEVKAPTSWDGQQLGIGWPNEGHKDMVEGDTIQRPPPEPTIFDEGFEWPSWLKWTVGGVVVVAGGALVLSLVRR